MNGELSALDGINSVITRVRQALASSPKDVVKSHFKERDNPSATSREQGAEKSARF